MEKERETRKYSCGAVRLWNVLLAARLAACQQTPAWRFPVMPASGLDHISQVHFSHVWSGHAGTTSAFCPLCYAL